MDFQQNVSLAEASPISVARASTPTPSCKAESCWAQSAGASEGECTSRCGCQWKTSGHLFDLTLNHEDRDRGVKSKFSPWPCQCSGAPLGWPMCQPGYPAPPTPHLGLLPQLLAPSDRVSVFGDSLTWLGGYIGQLQARATPGVTFFNHGINGGFGKDLLRGVTAFSTSCCRVCLVLA